MPKSPGNPFKRPAYFGIDHYGAGNTFGASHANAVIAHQRDSNIFRTSGVSTTPIFDNAVKYARGDGKFDSGIVYKIDSALFDRYEVTQFALDDYAVKPTLPDDKEVILVAEDYGVLSREIVVEEIQV